MFSQNTDPIDPSNLKINSGPRYCQIDRFKFILTISFQHCERKLF